MAKKETYGQAVEKLEKIVASLENNEIDIDELAEKLREAQALMAFCREKLANADKEIEKILSDKEK